MANDFYLESLQERLAQLDAERAAHLADLQAHRSNGDRTSASAAIQDIANCEAARQNVMDLGNRYVASQQPQQAPEPSREERAARPIERMDWQDVVDMTRTSKYARNIEPNDPNMIKGYHEAMRRKARGE
jgi:hypothetical protein